MAPSWTNAGLSCASDSRVVSARGCSSRASAGEPSSLTTGNSEPSNRLPSMARAAFCWLVSAKRSTSSRLKPSRVAIRSAEMPCGTMNSRLRSFSLRPSIIAPSEPIGTRDIDSTPPPMPASTKPAPILPAIMLTASRPEPQNRLTVTPVASSGPAAAIRALRAMHAPCSLTCVTQPIAMSSTRFLSSLRRSAMWLSVWARSSCGWICDRPPLPALPRPRGVSARNNQPQRTRHGLDPVALTGGQLLAVALRRRQRRAAHGELEPRAADRRSVAESERLEGGAAERAAPQAAEQLGTEVAPAGDRDELEAAVVGFGPRVEDPLASEDLGVLDDDVEHVLEVVDGAVDHGVDVELDVDDVALDEALQHRAGR